MATDKRRDFLKGEFLFLIVYGKFVLCDKTFPGGALSAAQKVFLVEWHLFGND
jgi:hypothetical protein